MGWQAAAQVAGLMPALTMRTLPSNRATLMPRPEKPCGVQSGLQLLSVGWTWKIWPGTLVSLAGWLLARQPKNGLYPVRQESVKNIGPGLAARTQVAYRVVKAMVLEVPSVKVSGMDDPPSPVGLNAV